MQLDGSETHLEAVADDGADAAARDGAAEAGGAAVAEAAGQRGAVKPEQLVAVGGAPGVLPGAGERTCLDSVPAVLEPLDGPLGVVDLQDPFDLADGVVLLEPAGLEDDLDDVPAGVFRSQLRHCTTAEYLMTWQLMDVINLLNEFKKDDLNLVGGAYLVR